MPGHLLRVISEARGALGLTLYFSTRLSFFDRFMVEGVMFTVLGKDTTCRVVEFKEVGDDGAVVRLDGAPREELEAVAEALWNRIWEVEQESQLRALAVATQGLQVDVRAGLSDLVDRMEKIALRLPSDTAKERLDDLGDDYILDKDRNQYVRTWGQKAAKRIGTAAVKKLTGLPGKVVDDIGKGAIKDRLDLEDE